MTLIIAEAGVNHNGDIELAKDLIDAAKAAEADIVKFQTFKAESLATTSAKQAEYQVRNLGEKTSQIEMLKKLELSHEEHLLLSKYSNSQGIKFLSTAFDSNSLAFLTKEMGVDILKIPSGELTNAPFVLEHACTDYNLIVSTGMASLADIESALGVIAYGFIGNPESDSPCESAFRSAYQSSAGQRALKNRVTLLHCTSEYPAPIRDINLAAIATMRSAFGLPIGYSDHSAGITVPIAAVALGACVIEKHLTLDRNMDGPDHQASLEPGEFEKMVTGIRDTEQALGNGIKAPRPSELKNRILARKSLFAARRIKAGEVFSEDSMVAKRPANGRSPYDLYELVGKTAHRNYREGEAIVD